MTSRSILSNAFWKLTNAEYSGVCHSSDCSMMIHNDVSFLRQFHQVTFLPFLRDLLGLPDLHQEWVDHLCGGLDVRL